jgi:SAM-dependent methyltransferase
MTLPSRIAKWLRAFRSLGWMRAELGDHAAELSRHRATFAAITASLDAITASLNANTASLARVDAVLPTLAMRADAEAARVAARAEIEQLDRELRRVDETHHAFARRIDPPLPPLIRAGSGDASVWLYAAFEETFRGSRDEIAARLSVYLSDAHAAVQATGGRPVVDIGCGRGEWIERLRDEGLTALGADTNAEMVAGCRARGIDVVQGDGADVLDAREPGSVAAVTAFHVVEHLPLAGQLRLMVAAYRALAPGGVLIMETPNPENVLVGAWTFYMDPTHLRPVPPSLLRFLIEASSFEVVDVRRLHTDDVLVGRARREGWPAGLVEILGAPRDYAIVARRP